MIVSHHVEVQYATRTPKFPYGRSSRCPHTGKDRCFNLSYTLIFLFNFLSSDSCGFNLLSMANQEASAEISAVTTDDELLCRYCFGGPEDG